MLEEDKKKELVEESSSGSQFMDSMTESIGDIVGNDDAEETPISELDSDVGSVAPNDLETERRRNSRAICCLSEKNYSKGQNSCQYHWRRLRDRRPCPPRQTAPRTKTAGLFGIGGSLAGEMHLAEGGDHQ